MATPDTGFRMFDKTVVQMLHRLESSKYQSKNLRIVRLSEHSSSSSSSCFVLQWKGYGCEYYDDIFYYNDDGGLGAKRGYEQLLPFIIIELMYLTRE